MSDKKPIIPQIDTETVNKERQKAIYQAYIDRLKAIRNQK